MRFYKMHGIGNDYVYVNGFEEQVDAPERFAQKVSNRHFGVGSDGLILLLPSEEADCRMRMFNADGSEAEMCGNGIRCVAKLAYELGVSRNNPMRIETKAGVLDLELEVRGDKVSRVRVNMGTPSLEPSKIPVNLPKNTGEIRVLDRDFQIVCVSMGNPHCVIFLDDDLDTFPIEKYGPLIETMEIFPQRTNVEFVRVLNRGEVVQRTWERGSGETLACGTGASAVCVAGVETNRTDRKIIGHLRGGDLELHWLESGAVMMTGPATLVFEGKFDEDWLQLSGDLLD